MTEEFIASTDPCLPALQQKLETLTAQGEFSDIVQLVREYFSRDREQSILLEQVCCRLLDRIKEIEQRLI